MKRFFGVLAASLVFGAVALASDFGPVPANYQSEAQSYLSDRMSGIARIEFLGDPYQVYADVSGYEGLACWAVDLRVKSKLPTGGYGAETLTVVFLDGQPVALKEDVVRMVRA